MTIEISSYEDFFRIAFAKRTEDSLQPFNYQKRLANEILPELLNVPTGTGKTAAIIGAWLWRRLNNPESVGRRLIYCLPMRTLVEQTREVAKAAIKNLEDEYPKLKSRFSVHTLYGGDVSDDWDIYPECEQIIIGTQDLLLSRALNRGYAMNRFRWAFHFGLFNNDCLWVFDEVQLFGDGLATTAQLQAFRENKEKFGTFGKSNSLWMSATLNEDWLKTVDFAGKVADLNRLELSEQDRENPDLKKRLNAVKSLRKAEDECRLPKGLADFAFSKHERGTQTLIVVNTVARAQEVYAEIERNYKNETEKPDIELLHSRFRPAERKQWQKLFDKTINDSSAGRIIIATQVIEAGVDISAKLLLTDIAPFPSLIQRFGRVNRKGEFDSSEIFWIDLPLTKNREKYATTDLARLDDKTLAEISKIVKPYEWENLEKSLAILEAIDSASPNDLRKIDYKEGYTPNHVLRQRDLIDLFDTTADLSGFDLDVSRFVRGGEERDISVYWRENVEENIKPIKGTKKEKKELAKLFTPHRDELCPVPIYDAKSFIDKKKAWTFDPLNGEWREIKSDNLRTGIIILLDATSGGYDKIGWNPKSKKVEIVPPESKKDENENLINESYLDDIMTFEPSPMNKYFRYTQTLQAHSREVKQAVEKILKELNLPELAEFSEQIIFAAHHHDLGKAHPVFQATVQRNNETGEINLAEPLAKAKSGGKHSRKKFRHELASALALLEMNRSNLEIYLAASHHGKVRLSIRALPDETKPFELDENENYKPLNKKYARGIWDDDELPETDLGDEVKIPKISLNLNAMQLGKNVNGGESWLERMINLRDELGVFRLAYLEAIVRAADVQASAFPQDYKEKGDAENDK
ncbi:MAG: CRISPR-associated helicase Cas3' [Pyrinomonadaceae bacterium]